MPVEILELIIRAEIQEDQPASQTSTDQQDRDTNETGSPSMVEVAEQVREILKRKKER